MKIFEKLANGPGLKNIFAPGAGKLDPILGRIDLIAILTSMLGAGVLAVAAVALTAIELVKLVSSLWSDSFDRRLIMALGFTLLWVVARRNKLCTF